jgi:CheY-like chemotaxis protein
MPHPAEISHARVLAVDDEPFDLLLIDRYLSRAGFEVTRANSGAHGLRQLERCGDDLPEAILLDRMMPEMNGIEFMELLAASPRLRDIPVIMQTGLADPDQIAFGIARGARYYIAKPFTGDVLVSMVRAAVGDYRQLRSLRDATLDLAHNRELLRSACYELRTLQDARTLAAHLAQFFPQPQRVAIGIVEMLVNAVEHGNLGLQYDDKSALLRAGDWEAEIARRLALPEYRERRVHVGLRRHDGRTTLNIRDEGAGFDWQPFLEIRPERVFDLHGRGIAMTRLASFDTVEYRGCGNEVELGVNHTAGETAVDGGVDAGAGEASRAA